MTKHLSALLVLSIVTCVPLSAQSPPPSEPLTTYLQRSFAAVSKNLAAVAELMPAENYVFKPAESSIEQR